jgi:prevent-host-death family protein
MKAVRTVSATEFKQHCLALLEEVRQTRQSVVVTRHGKPVAEISPYILRERDSANPLKGSTMYQVGETEVPPEVSDPHIEWCCRIN